MIADRLHIPLPTVDMLRNACLWLMMASSFFVIVEPAPVDLLFPAVLLLFAVSGLRLTLSLAPLILFLLLYNLGGLIGLMPVWENDNSRMFIITSVYMAVSAIFFAAYVAEDPVKRFPLFASAYVFAAVIASVIAIAGYFDVGGWGPILSPISRAQGTFKDPNVLSTYLIFPAVYLLHGLLTGQKRLPLLSAGGFVIMLLAIFLSFSRGAWMNFMLSAALVTALTFALTPLPKLRLRIIMLALIGVIALAVLIIYLLSIPEVADIFSQRLTLAMGYDEGERGRFGIQLRSLQYVFETPLGFGPRLFYTYFGQDPHNVYLNAFASYGWLGGLSYVSLIVATLIVGCRAVFTQGPYQSMALVAAVPLFATILQGIQIDTDHWRHFYWLLGLTWGFYAATQAHVPLGQRKTTHASSI